MFQDTVGCFRLARRIGFGFAVAVLCSSMVVAGGYCADQPPPGARAGVVDRTIKTQDMDLDAEKSMPLLVDEPEKPKAGVKSGQLIAVKGFEFEDNTVYSSERLSRLLSEYIDQDVSMSELQEACAKITYEYARDGYFLARAYLPPQDIVDGIVKIAVLEGRLGQVTVSGASNFADYFVQRHFVPLAGKPLNYKELLKVLLILNEYRDFKVSSTLQKGSEPATTDVLIYVEDSSTFHFSADYNNNGSKYVSRNRFGLTADMGNLVAQGDQTYLKSVFGDPFDALTYVGFGYGLPLGYYGTKLNLSYTYSSFNVGEEFAELDIEGDTNIISADVTHPLLRSRKYNMDAFVGFDFKDIVNSTLGVDTSHDKLRVIRTGLSFDRIDDWKGRNYFSVSGSFGLADFLDGSEARDPMASRAGAGGEFSVLNMDFRRIQSMPWRSYMIVKAAAQMTGYTLPSSQQFIVGGVDTVRGYRQSQLLGDEGMNLGLELRVPPLGWGEFGVPFTEKTWNDCMQLRASIDYGEVRLKNALVGEDKSSNITGAGLGLLFFFPGDLNASFDVGFPIAKDDADDVPDTTVYIQVSKRFL